LGGASFADSTDCHGTTVTTAVAAAIKSTPMKSTRKAREILLGARKLMLTGELLDAAAPQDSQSNNARRGTRFPAEPDVNARYS
jgi:hypothetical protein